MQNNELRIQIQPKGAELSLIQDIKSGFEFLWQGNPAIWSRKAPVLFPIVGKVKHNQLLIDGTAYPMNQHGFARDQTFKCSIHSELETWYELHSSQTSELFPFSYLLKLGYKLENRTLLCHYEVINTGDQTMYFSIGAHPGLMLPTPKLNEYLIEFNQQENKERLLLSQGLFDGRSAPVFTSPTTIQLGSNSFEDDAIVLRNLQSTSLTLKHQHSQYAVQLDFPGFTDLGIWSQKGCEQYVCLEPWCGHADSVDGHDDISTKPGIIRLPAGEIFKRTYSLTFTAP